MMWVGLGVIEIFLFFCFVCVHFGLVCGLCTHFFLSHVCVCVFRK